MPLVKKFVIHDSQHDYNSFIIEEVSEGFLVTEDSSELSQFLDLNEAQELVKWMQECIYKNKK